MSRIAVVAAFVALASISMLPARAASLTWDANTGTTGAQDGNGTWDTTNTNWWNGAANTNWNNTTPDSAIIGLGAANTISLGTGISIGGLTLANSYLIRSNTLTLVGTPVISIANIPTISSVLAGSGFIKTNSGALSLNGANTYTGQTTLAGGIIVANNNTALGRGTFAFSNSAIRLMITNGVTVTNAITIGANAGQTGLGLIMPAGSSTSTVAGPITVNSGAAAGGHFASTNGGLLRVTGAITSTSVIVQMRAGNVLFSGGGSYPQMILGADYTQLGANNGIATNALLNLGGSAAATFDLKTFSQTLAGLTNVNASTLVSNRGAMATVTLNVLTNTTYGGTILEAINLVKTGAATQTLNSGNSTFTGSVNVAGGELRVTAGAGTATSALGQRNSGRTVTVQTNATLMLAINNALGGSAQSVATFPQIVVNTGTVNATRYSAIGNITLNGGVLTQSSTDAGGYGGYQFVGTIAAGGSSLSTITTGNGKGNHLRGAATNVFSVADVTAGTDLLINAPVLDGSPDYSGVGSLEKTGAGTLLLDAVNPFTGRLNVNAGTVAVGATGSVAATTINVASGAVLDVSAFSRFVVQAGQTVQGGGTVAGPLGLNAGAQFSAGGYGTPGTLFVTGSVAALSTGATNLFDLTNSLTAGNGVNDLIVIGDSFEPSNSVVYINATAPLASGRYKLLTFAGPMTSIFDPVVRGNTYRGVSMDLDYSVGNEIGLIVTSGAPTSLRWTADTSADWDFGTTNWTDTGTLLADRYFDFDTVRFDDEGGDSNEVNIVALVRPASLVIDSSSNYTFTGTGRIGDGFGALTPVKSGTGSLTVRTTNTFSGGIIISNGAVVVGGNNVIGTGTIVAAGGQMAGDGGTWALPNNLQLNTTLALDSAGGTLALSGLLLGSGDFRKTGSGTVALSADPPADLWTGNVTVAAGTLSLTAVGNAWPFGSATTMPRTVTVDSGATLSAVNGGDNNLLGVETIGLMNLVVSNGTVLAPRYQHAKRVDMWGGSILANGAPVDGLDLRTGAYLRVWNDANAATIDTKVTLRGDTPVDVDDGLNAVDLAFTTNFTGNSFFLVKTNAGTMVLSGNTDNSSTKLRNDGGTTILAKTSSASVHAVGFSGLGLVINDGTVQLGGSGGDQIYVNIDALIAAPGRLDFNGQSDGFDELSGTGTVINTAAATVSTMTVGQNNGANFIFAGSILDGAGQMALTKQGTGTFTLSGNSAYTGQTTVQTGTLSIAGTVTGSVAVVASNAVLAGSGAFNGLVIGSGGARVIPGSATTVGTLSLSSLSLQANDILQFELTNATTVGAGVNDLIAVGDALEPNGASIQIVPRAPLASGTYTLLTYGGAKGSTFATFVTNTTRKTLAIDELTPNQINLIVSGSYLDLKWNAQASTNWDSVGANWLDTVGLTNTTFLDGDTVTFDESGAVSNDVNLVGLLQPGAMTVKGASNYFIRGAGRLGGTMSLLKDGAGELQLGGTNTFTGPITISGGVVRLIANGALGLMSSLTVAPGGQLNLNGLQQTNSYLYAMTIAGSGPDGRGAIVNTTATVNANSPVRLLTLAGDATIGALGSTIANDGARIDIANGGWVQGNGYTLTKVGVSPVSMRGGSTNLQIVVAEGFLYQETVSNALGTNVIVQSGAILGAINNFGGGPVLTPVTLNGGTLASRAASGAVNWAAPVTLAADSIVATSPGYGVGEENITISGQISGPGSLTKISNNTLFVSATNSYLGGTTVAKGTLQIGTNSASGSVVGGIVVSNIGVLRYSRSDSFTLANPITGNGLLYVNVASGLVVDATASINLGGGIEVPKSAVGSLIVMPGASITASNLFLGNDSGFKGEVWQHGGSVTVNAGSLRVGHWGSETSLYVMAGGSLVVTNETAANPLTGGSGEPGGALYIGTDGAGIMIMTGGTVRAGGIVMDNRSETPGVDTLVFEGGTITLGRWGIQGSYTSVAMLVGGGTFSADTNWTCFRPMTLTGTNGPAIFDPAGWTVSVTGLLSGVGGLVKNGSGTLVLQPGSPNSFTGGTVVNGGTLQLNYANGVSNFGTLRGALTVNSGAVVRATIEKALGFAAAASGNVTVVTLNEGLLDFTGLNGVGGGQTYFLNGGEIRSNLGVPTSTGGALRINATGTNWTIYTTASNAIPLVSGRIALDTTNARFDVADSTNETDLAIVATITDGVFGNAVNSLVKTNNGTMALHGIALYSGTTAVDGGRLLVQTTGASGTGTNTLTVGAGGTLGGTGLIGGPVISDGIVAPGASAGLLTLGREYTQNAGGLLSIELGGTVPGVNHDLLVISNAAALAGSLTVTLIDGFTPATSDTFTVLSAASVAGTFATATLPALPSGQGWFIDYQPAAVVLSITSAPSASGYDLAALAITNGLSGYGDDADGDGYANLLEYATGGNLTNADTTARMDAARTNGLLALKFLRATNSTDVTLIVEGSYAATNGAGWIGIATNVAGLWGSATNVTESVGGNPVNVTVWDTTVGATNRFLRLHVTRP